MPRSKNRYAPAVDNAFVDACEAFDIEPFQMETYLVICFALAADMAGVIDECDTQSVSHTLQKIVLTHAKCPVVTVDIQERLPF